MTEEEVEGKRDVPYHILSLLVFDLRVGLEMRSIDSGGKHFDRGGNFHVSFGELQVIRTNDVDNPGHMANRPEASQNSVGRDRRSIARKSLNI
jgi:hypothetical protein